MHDEPLVHGRGVHPVANAGRRERVANRRRLGVTVQPHQQRISASHRAPPPRWDSQRKRRQPRRQISHERPEHTHATTSRNVVLASAPTSSGSSCACTTQRAAVPVGSCRTGTASLRSSGTHRCGSAKLLVTCVNSVSRRCACAYNTASLVASTPSSKWVILKPREGIDHGESGSVFSTSTDHGALSPSGCPTATTWFGTWKVSARCSQPCAYTLAASSMNSHATDRAPGAWYWEVRNTPAPSHHSA